MTNPQATAGWKPIVSAEANATAADINYKDGSQADGTVSKEAALTMDQPLYRGGRTVAGIAAADSRILAQRARLAGTTQSIFLAAIQATADTRRDRQILGYRIDNENLVGRQEGFVQERLNGGEVTKTDLSQSQARKARAVAERLQAAADLESSTAVFVQVVGATPPDPLPTVELTLPLPKDLESAINTAYANNPDIIVAQNDHDAAEHDIDSNKGALLPEVSLSARLSGERDPQPGDVSDVDSGTIGIFARLPLYEAGATRSRVRQAKNIAHQREQQISQTRDRVRQEVVTAWQRLQAAMAEIKAREAQLESALQAQNGVQEETDLGERSILDSLDAYQELLEARVALSNAARNKIIAEYQLAASLGILTPDVVGIQNKGFDPDIHLADISGKIFSMETDREE